MKAKKIVVFSLCALAILSVVCGLLVFFFTFKGVKDIPSVPTVERIDGKFIVTTKYNPNFSYKFKIEKFLSGEYINIEYVESDVNKIDLGDFDKFSVDDNYRFSVCYVGNNGEEGKYSDAYEWKLTQRFEGTVDYSTLNFENDHITWNAVDGTSVYSYIISQNGEQVARGGVLTADISCEDLAVGQYEIYISCATNSINILPSSYGEGKVFNIVRQNIVKVVSRSGNNLLVSCSQDVKKFRLYVDDSLISTVDAIKSADGYHVNLSTLNVDDFVEHKVEIMSEENGLYITASEKVRIN